MEVWIYLGESLRASRRDFLGRVKSPFEEGVGEEK